MLKSILYLGSLNESSNSFRRFKTLQRLTNKISAIDTDLYIYKSVFAKFHHHLNIGPGIFTLNKGIIKKIEENAPDIIWVDNKPFLQSWALKKIKSKWPHIKIVDLITDDPTGIYQNAWRLCLRNAKYFDFHFVQRSVNIHELKNHGAKRVEICYRSYDPSLHRPVKLDAEDQKKFKTRVGFIGTHENYREEFIVHLLRNNVPVSITGNDWQNAKEWEIIKPFYRGPSVYGEAYIKTINGFDIALHFLRHKNRDEQDSRTFEIPACGIFMLGEKSKVHLSLFREGKEAAFFETKEELLNKVKYYLEHQEERDAIAKAGHERCLSSGYSHEAKLKEVINIIFE